MVHIMGINPNSFLKKTSQWFPSLGTSWTLHQLGFRLQWSEASGSAFAKEAGFPWKSCRGALPAQLFMFAAKWEHSDPDPPASPIQERLGKHLWVLFLFFKNLCMFLKIGGVLALFRIQSTECALWEDPFTPRPLGPTSPRRVLWRFLDFMSLFTVKHWRGITVFSLLPNR